MSIDELTAKLSKIDEQLNNTSDYSNPIRNNLLEVREELLEYAKAFEEDLLNLDAKLVNFYLIPY